MNVALVILDLDGTIVDHEGSVRTALTIWLPALGVASDEQLTAAWLAAEQRHLPAWRAGEISFQEQRRRRLRDFLPLIGGHATGSDSELDLIFDGYLTEYEASWTAFDDVAPTLAILDHSDIRLAVLSNGTDAQQNAKITAVGLRNRIGPVFTAEGLGVAKPDPRAYLAVCQKLNVPPTESLHVGDLYDLDVLAPRDAGLHAIHLDRTDSGPLDETWRMTTLRQLPNLIEMLQS